MQLLIEGIKSKCGRKLRQKHPSFPPYRRHWQNTCNKPVWLGSWKVETLFFWMDFATPNLTVHLWLWPIAIILMNLSLQSNHSITLAGQHLPHCSARHMVRWWATRCPSKKASATEEQPSQVAAVHVQKQRRNNDLTKLTIPEDSAVLNWLYGCWFCSLRNPQ